LEGALRCIAIENQRPGQLLNVFLKDAICISRIETVASTLERLDMPDTAVDVGACTPPRTLKVSPVAHGSDSGEYVDERPGVISIEFPRVPLKRVVGLKEETGTGLASRLQKTAEAAKVKAEGLLYGGSFDYLTLWSKWSRCMCVPVGSKQDSIKNEHELTFRQEFFDEFAIDVSEWDASKTLLADAKMLDGYKDLLSAIHPRDDILRLAQRMVMKTLTESWGGIIEATRSVGADNIIYCLSMCSPAPELDGDSDEYLLQFASTRPDFKLQMHDAVDPGYSYWGDSDIHSKSSGEEMEKLVRSKELEKDEEDYAKEEALEILNKMFADGQIPASENQIFDSEITEDAWSRRIHVLERKADASAKLHKNWFKLHTIFSVDPAKRHLYQTYPEYRPEGIRQVFLRPMDRITLMGMLIRTVLDVSRLEDEHLIDGHFAMHDANRFDAVNLHTLRRDWVSGPFAGDGRPVHNGYISPEPHFDPVHESASDAAKRNGEFPPDIQRPTGFARMKRIFRQPLDAVQQYMGSEIAMYFSFLGYYTYMLIYPAAIGMAFYAYKTSKHWSHFQKTTRQKAVLQTLMQVFIMTWGEFLLAGWRAKQATLAMKWGSEKSASVGETRQHFKGTTRMSPVNNQHELHADSNAQGRRAACSSACMFVQLVFLFSFITGCFAFRDYAAGGAFEAAKMSAIQNAAESHNDGVRRLMATTPEYTFTNIAKIHVNNIYEIGVQAPSAAMAAATTVAVALTNVGAAAGSLFDDKYAEGRRLTGDTDAPTEAPTFQLTAAPSVEPTTLHMHNGECNDGDGCNAHTGAYCAWDSKNAVSYCACLPGLILDPAEATTSCTDVGAPTRMPTKFPTAQPTITQAEHDADPTAFPTKSPTFSPTHTASPTPVPPTMMPTLAPTYEPPLWKPIMGMGAGDVIVQLQAVAIVCLGEFFKFVAKQLTEMENHQLESSFTDAFVWKCFVFNICNYYGALLYAAFVQKEYSGCFPVTGEYHAVLHLYFLASRFAYFSICPLPSRLA
jgi:hypothetical protein